MLSGYNKLPGMWVIAFFSVLLVVIIVYALLVKRNTSPDEYNEKMDTPDSDYKKPGSPL